MIEFLCCLIPVRLTFGSREYQVADRVSQCVGGHPHLVVASQADVGQRRHQAHGRRTEQGIAGLLLTECHHGRGLLQCGSAAWRSNSRKCNVTCKHYRRLGRKPRVTDDGAWNRLKPSKHKQSSEESIGIIGGNDAGHFRYFGLVRPGPEEVSGTQYSNTLYEDGGSCKDISATYQLNRKYRQFQATVGLDDRSDSGANFTFEVFTGDQADQLATPVRTISFGHIVSIDVDVTGSLRMEPYATCNEPFGTAVWINPILIP